MLLSNWTVIDAFDVHLKIHRVLHTFLAEVFDCIQRSSFHLKIDIIIEEITYQQ